MQCTGNFSRCPEGVILGCGNPLLDMRVEVSLDFLKKWNLEEDDAIIADDERMPMFQELLDNYDITYTPGGATQNSLRVCQWILNEPNRSVFFGCIGDDHYGDILKQKTQEIGLRVYYQVKEKQKTGTCAALITNQHRSLCAHLAAANLFTIDHLEKLESRVLIETAQYFYISGFFLTVCPAAVMFIAQHASKHNKVFATNLAAPFVLKYFRNEFLELLPYVDILFGNEREGKAFADAINYNTHELQQICVKIAAFSKINEKRQRIVILTQGSGPTIVYQNGNNDAVKYPVKKLKHEEIVDTNGAGDAFVGGFLSQYIQQKSIADSVKCGHYAAAVIIQQEGCTLPPICLYH
ncbi:Adenosine kinase-like [Brugia malayi]|uniref:Adenosine kinase n=1 Tax=Brugia malayi TaxID=6279 RepID=A0A4E9EUF3_BRUMA|nr:Adenosine kinase-like [Brugia malayi]VIO87827.1 Adenosine kinase-like [Brugia malayi]